MRRGDAAALAWGGSLALAALLATAAPAAAVELTPETVVAVHPRGTLTLRELELGGAMKNPPATKEMLRGWIVRSAAVDYTLPEAERLELESTVDFLLPTRTFWTRRLADVFYRREVMEAARPTREEVLASIGVCEDRPLVFQIIAPTAEEAESARGRVLAGEPFETVAKEVSSGLNAHLGGACGYLAPGSGHYTPEEEALLSSLQPGQTSEVVPGPLGYSVFRVTAVLSAAEQVERDFAKAEELLHARRMAARARETEARLRAAATIVVHEELLATPPYVGVPKYPPVVAEVDGRPIFYDGSFARSSRAKVGYTEADRRKVLASAVTSLLYALEAQRRGYDRDADFVADFEPLRRKGLWRAYATYLTENPPVSDEEIVAAYLRGQPKPAKGKPRKKLTIAGVPPADRERITAELKAGKRATAAQTYYNASEAQVTVREEVFPALWEKYRRK